MSQRFAVNVEAFRLDGPDRVMGGVQPLVMLLVGHSRTAPIAEYWIALAGKASVTDDWNGCGGSRRSRVAT